MYIYDISSLRVNFVRTLCLSQISRSFSCFSKLKGSSNEMHQYGA